MVYIFAISHGKVTEIIPGLAKKRNMPELIARDHPKIDEQSIVKSAHVTPFVHVNYDVSTNV